MAGEIRCHTDKQQEQTTARKKPNWLSERRLACRLTPQLTLGGSCLLWLLKQQGGKAIAQISWSVRGNKMLYIILRASPLVPRVYFPLVKYLLLFFMTDSVVVVVDSRCWVLVARATVAMALRPHQGNCCYPPAPFPPPSLLWLAESCQIILKWQRKGNFYYKALHAHLWKIPEVDAPSKSEGLFLNCG